MDIFLRKASSCGTFLELVILITSSRKVGEEGKGKGRAREEEQE